MASLLRHVGLPRATFVVAAFVIGSVTLIGATGATAGPGVSTTTPFFFAGANPCTLEALEGNGHMHFLLTGNVSASGNIQGHLDVNISGVQAMTVTGKKYVVTNEEGLTDTFDSDGAPAHQTVEHTFQLVRSGEDGSIVGGDDFYEKFLAHFTVNANGIVTVDDYTLDPHCK